MVFSSCTPQRQSSFAITIRLVNHHQPTVSMADQLNALPDPPAPAGAQQAAEPAQNPPQELEPTAEPAAAPAAAPAAPVEVTFFIRFSVLFWCAIQTFCQHVSVYCPRFVELFLKECYHLVRCCLPVYCPRFP